MKSAQTPTPISRESVTITLTPQELEDVIFALELYHRHTRDKLVFSLIKRLSFLKPNIGDACRHSAHIPEALGQGGTQ